MLYTAERLGQRRSNRRAAFAFTLVELLVVTGIIVLLIAIALPMLSTARDAAKRATCASQLRQIGQALTAYATDNDAKFPDNGTEGHTFVNINYRSRKLLGDEVLKSVFYCPTDDPPYAAGWSTPLGGVAAIPPPTGTPIAQYPYVTVGYALLYARNLGGTAGPGPQPIPTPAHQPPIQVPPDTFPMPRPQALRGSSASIPLACDLIRSNTASPANPVFERRAHMKSNGWPSGQNVLYLDGHVQWLNFSQSSVQSPGGIASDIIPQYQDPSPAWVPQGYTAQTVYWYEWQKQVSQ